jgi:hypothetical protein
MYLEPSAKKFKMKVSRRRLVLLGVENRQKNIPLPIDGENFLQQFEVSKIANMHSWKIHFSASKRSKEVNNPIKMTAIITLGGAKGG